MAEGIGQPEGRAQATGFIRNPQDFWGGLALVAFALFSLWAGSPIVEPPDAGYTDLAWLLHYRFKLLPRKFAL